MNSHQMMKASIVAVLLTAAISEALPVSPHLLSLTREAPVIAVGLVLGSDSASVTLQVSSVLKGAVTSSPLKVLRSGLDTLELPDRSFVMGQRLVVFGEITAAGLKPSFGEAGIKSPAADEEAFLVDAVRALLYLDAAQDATARTNALMNMLASSNPLQREEALTAIYLDRRPILKGVLVNPVLGLAQGADLRLSTRAIQALRQVGDKIAVDALIEMLRSSHLPTAGQAHVVLEGLLGTPVAVDPTAPLSERDRSVQQLRIWWSARRDVAQLAQ